MRFVSMDGILQKVRRYVSGGANVSDEEVKDPVKLAEIIRTLTARVTALEARTAPESAEFEVEVGSLGAITRITHGFNSPVRFYVTYWIQKRDGSTSPTGAPALVVDSSSTLNVLALKSFLVGRAVIRIEPASSGITFQA